MAKIIAIANQKGGVSKTTTALALCKGLSLRHYKVLAVDMDAQSNMSVCCEIDVSDEAPTVYNLLIRDGKYTIDQVIQHSPRGFDVIPANTLMYSADTTITGIGKEHRLSEALESVVDRYDFIILDTPPNLGLATIISLRAATDVIIPASGSLYDVRGVMRLADSISDIRKYLGHPDIRVMGILLTRFDMRTTANRQMRAVVEESIAPALGTTLFNTYIRNTTAVKDAQIELTDILTYDRNSTAGMDYRAFVDEVIERSGMKHGK